MRRRRSSHPRQGRFLRGWPARGVGRPDRRQRTAVRCPRGPRAVSILSEVAVVFDADVAPPTSASGGCQPERFWWREVSTRGEVLAERGLDDRRERRRDVLVAA